MNELKKLRESHLEELENIVYYYDDLCKRGHKLNSNQRLQLKEASYAACVFGDFGEFLHEIAEELLAS